MLDQITKRKIDSARNILVGKVPDPKAQVEQITTALIYKFMDDMDKKAEELGGKSEFFSNGYEKYSWTKLMDKRLSGQERLDLYVQAITNMSKNPHIPQLFRDMFKDAFLPYRDYEVLSLFLKEIDWFSYEHSENLGDAFEYLLSVLGSQGEAGQFRTPRHIIDFIVEVVDPKKNEIILDPACGTAGFLISSYKHIMKHNSSSFKPAKEKAEEKIQEGETVAETVLQEKDAYMGDKLSPEDKTRIMENIAGYDISPDMVKLSLVNLYLHGFSDPRLFEYDTLGSEKRWNESFDVIMANPPFMTPKGGIRPHKRFQVQANRSEVLFVDYILEHLNVNGRAGIIVPEGIIFQSANAYKQLRKLLIEDGLFAVVSLPPGVFNPYSGVKTSILFFDSQLAKKTEEILFVKVKNDGFDLGAQRRKIDKNDLPEALSIIEAWKKGEKQESDRAVWASKAQIAESGDHNLAIERYKQSAVYISQKWPIIELGEICSFEYGKPLKKSDRKNGEFPVFGSNGIVGYHNKFLVEGPFIIVGRKGTAGAVTYSEKSGYPIDTTFFVRLKDANSTDLKFLFQILRTLHLDKVNVQAGIPGLNRNDAYKIKIPFPPIEVQREIVEQIEVKQKAIEHAKAVIKNLERERHYFGQSLRKLDESKWVELGEICKFVRGPFGGSLKKEIFKPSGYLVYEQYHAINNNFEFARYFIDEKKFEEMKRFEVFPGDLLISCSGTMGKTAIIPEKYKEGIINQALLKLTPSGDILVKYLKLILESDFIQKMHFKDQSGAAIQNVASVKNLQKIKIPLPQLEEQQQLIVEAEKEEEIIKSNQELISLMETKIDNVLGEI